MDISIDWQLVAYVLFLAVVVERTVEFFFKMFPGLLAWNTEKLKLQLILSFALSLLICWGANLDLFVIANITFGIPFVGYVLIACGMAGGTIGVHSIFSIAETQKELNKANKAYIESFKT